MERMSEQSAYNTLGISADASFEEVQSARDRLLEGCESDPKQAEVIEAAYDAVLMDRLRMRQEGKIKVPERIRFPDRLMEAAPNTSLPTVKKSPAWLQRFLDTPSRNDILWPALTFSCLSALGLLYPVSSAAGLGVLQLALALGIGFSLYFLNRKENRFGRAFVITLAGLLLGLILGSLIVSPLQPQLIATGLQPEQAITVFTFLVLWLVDSFLR
jgi:hypothetical protein